MSLASDKRDHLYSSLLLAQRSYGIQPSYQPDIVSDELFSWVMRILLQNTGNIDLIKGASTAPGDRSDTLPSWVPDRAQPIVRVDAEYKRGLSLNPRAGGNTTAHIEFLEDGRVLQTKVVLLDVLVREVKAQIWRGKRTDRIHTFNYLWGVSPRPRSHVSSRPPAKGDEVWILHGSGRPFLLRKSGYRDIFLRSVHVYRVKYTEVENGEFTEFGVELEAETKTLQIR